MTNVHFRDKQGRIVEVQIADRWAEYMAGPYYVNLELLPDGTARLDMTLNEEGWEHPYAFKLQPARCLPVFCAESSKDKPNSLVQCKKRPDWYKHNGEFKYPAYIMFETQLYVLESELETVYRILKWE